MDGNQDDVNTAKLEREIFHRIVAKGGKSDDFDDLIQNEKSRIQKSKLFSFFGIGFFVKITAETAEDDKNQKPCEMKKIKM